MAILASRCGFKHYVKGWDKKDQQRAGDRKAEEIETHTKRSEKAPVDYLNREIEY